MLSCSVLTAVDYISEYISTLNSANVFAPGFVPIQPGPPGLTANKGGVAARSGLKLSTGLVVIIVRVVIELL